jgi:transcriptional regulator with XRE-family HTH domain
MRKSIYSKEQKALQLALRHIRIKAGLSQSDLAARVGKPQSFVSKYESGERRLDLPEIREICKASNIKLVEFIKLFESFLEGK